MTINETEQEGSGRQIPPKKEYVFIYFSQKSLPQSEADRFYNHYEGIGWKNANGNPVKNWKTLASEWIWNKKFRHLCL